MTTLTDPMVADVCRRAGFVGPELVTAIASALATSGGVAAYDHPIWPGPLAHYRGLWGLDTVEHPDYAGVEMENPQTAAHVARELTTRGDFSWCPGWRAGHDRGYEDRARMAAGMLPGLETIIDPVTVHISRRRARDAIDASGRTVDLLTRHTFGG